MRLLEITESGEIQLKEFSRDIPRYAILSHTWGSEEVSFTDMISISGKKKLNDKIKFCVKQARLDGLRYFWVDTCCLDRKNLDELYDAINAMFYWYRYAAKCYVYLEDVSRAIDGVTHRLAWEKEFRNSRWFTRGWTLQELIAPNSVQFFSRQGVYLGDRRSLEVLIYHTTEIPLRALQGVSLSEFSITERLTWIQRRQTTIPEDKAYSMLGIFDVRMPLSYGEGEESAMNRLLQKIQEASDLTIPDMSALDSRALDSIADRYIRERWLQQVADNKTDSGYGGSGSGSGSSGFRSRKRRPIPRTTLPKPIPEDDIDEAHTVYSDTESLKGLSFLDFVTVFVDELYESLPGFDNIRFQRVVVDLDELLRAFACRLSCDGSTSEHRTLMYVVHRYRSQIIEKFGQKYEGSGRGAILGLTNSDDMTIEDKLSLLWRDRDDNTDYSVVADIGVEHKQDNEIDVDTTQLPDPKTCRETLKQASSFRWLLRRIMAADKLECPGPLNAQKSIRRFVLRNAMLQKRFSRGKFQRVCISYQIDWKLEEFHAEQQYSCALEQVLEQAIVITGHENDVQALTCSQYVSQTWGDFGLYLLHVLQEAIRDNRRVNSPRNETRPKKDEPADLYLSASYMQRGLLLFAAGLPYSVAEVGELLGWLVASLQSSPMKEAAVSCTPLAMFSFQSHTRSSDVLNLPPRTTGTCKFRLQIQKGNIKSTNPPGSCWLDSFRNPVVVQGFPILRRSQAGRGLEVSIDIMSSLVNTKYQVDFCRRTFLKGFSTLLAVTEIIGSTVYWHLFYNANKEYISYEDVRIPRLQENEAPLILDETVLASGRHILGWSERVSCLAGTRHANYNIGWSKLRRPHSTFAFDKISIAAGKHLNIGTSLSIGIKDKPEHVRYEDDYLSTLQMISDRYFVLYDINDRQAWLVDGASTLLHLLRAFINYSQTKSRLKDFFLFGDNELEEGDETQKHSDAAFYVLANEHNQLLPLWRKAANATEEITLRPGNRPEEALRYQKAYFCLKDRVLQICRVLQQIIAHQDDMHSRDGVGARIKLMPRRQLEGFDFMDVATNQGTLWPKADYIHAYGEGWVDFTRELHCVTLFGTRFEKLIRPMGDPCRLCMSNIPQGPYLLGITMADFLAIVEKHGDDSQSPWRVIEDIHWYVPDKLFDPCRCGPTTTAKSDRVQVFLPATHRKLRDGGLRAPQLEDDGAILIGHSFKYPLRWGNRRDPQEGEPEVPSNNSRAISRDSGIGSSDPSESTENSRSPPNLRSSRSTLNRLQPIKSGSLNSSIFMHANKQFLHSTESNLERYREPSTLPIRSGVSSQERDRSTGSRRDGLGHPRRQASGIEFRSAAEEPAATGSRHEVGQTRRSDATPLKRARTGGNLSGLWSAMGKRQQKKG